MKRGEKERSTTVGIKSHLVTLSLFDGRPNQKTLERGVFLNYDVKVEQFEILNYVRYS